MDTPLSPACSAGRPERPERHAKEPRIILISGERNSGKTTRLWREIARYRAMPEVRLGGVATLPVPPGVASKSEYVLQDIQTGESRLLMSEQEIPGGERFGRFFVDTSVFSWGNSVILAQFAHSTHIVFDEIGRIELSGGGLAPSFSVAVRQGHIVVIAVVRTSFLSDVVRTFALDMDDCSVISCVRA